MRLYIKNTLEKATKGDEEAQKFCFGKGRFDMTTPVLTFPGA